MTVGYSSNKATKEYGSGNPAGLHARRGHTKASVVANLEWKTHNLGTIPAEQGND